ncbi:MAG: calcium-binding protein, partial [Pseudoruegeria sp.]
FGGDGYDHLIGGEGDDILSGGAGDDTLEGGFDNDEVTGGLGQDAIMGGGGDDILSGVVQDPQSGEDLHERDYLNGGVGDDTIQVGNDDVVTGGEGQDNFLLGDWISDGSAATIMDFNAAQDSLLIQYDGISEVEPEVTIESSDADGEPQSQVFLDGLHIATLNGVGDLSVDQITLIN